MGRFRALWLLAALALPACDCGALPTAVPLLAVGSKGQVSFIDSCAGAVPIDRGLYAHCTDDSVVSFDSIGLTGPFERAGVIVPTVFLLAADAGTGRLHVVVTEQTGKQQSFDVDLEAAEIAHVEAGFRCIPAASEPAQFEPGAFIDFTTAIKDDRSRVLSTVGLTDLYELDGGGLVWFPDGGGNLPGSEHFEAGLPGGELWITSPRDPGLQAHGVVVSPAGITLAAGKPNFVNRSFATLEVTASTTAGPICALAPTHSWSAHVDTPDVCLLDDQPDGGRAGLVSRAGVDGQLPKITSSSVLPQFHFFKVDAGTCRFDVFADQLSGTVEAGF